MSARWLTESSPSRSASTSRIRVASANMEKISTASSTNWLSVSHPHISISAFIRRFLHTTRMQVRRAAMRRSREHTEYRRSDTLGGYSKEKEERREWETRGWAESACGLHSLSVRRYCRSSGSWSLLRGCWECTLCQRTTPLRPRPSRHTTRLPSTDTKCLTKHSIRLALRLRAQVRLSWVPVAQTSCPDLAEICRVARRWSWQTVYWR